MSELNVEQKKLCDTTEGFVWVDAGPGTGKTHTIVQRYVNILKKKVDPMDVLMLTFTRNAAEEMETRIATRISELISSQQDPDGVLEGAVKNLRVSTIDSFCLEVVLNSPEVIRDFFDPQNKQMMLSRSASLSENETLNKQYFSEYYASFIRDRGSDYTDGDMDITAVLGEHPMDVYILINKLMSRGIIPTKNGWFTGGKDTLIGNRDVMESLIKGNMPNVAKKIKDMRNDGEYVGPVLPEKFTAIPDEMIDEAVNDDRELLLKVIHDIFYGYIAHCIKDNRLTFGLCELFALIILSKDRDSREMHSVEYLTIDEFQDTNELQMKICLLLLKKPNMCVVGDWKQGIFEFRYVSIDNITDFPERIEKFCKDLSEYGIEIPFDTYKTIPIAFQENYRSSQAILDLGFKSLDIPANDSDVVRHKDVAELTSVNNEVLKEWTRIECIQADDKDDEIIKAVDMITRYRFSGNYRIWEQNKDEWDDRDVEYGDIAVLCRTSNNCTRVFDECKRRGIPAFLQGDIEIMSTKEGKLLLAWLRYLNDPTDRRGLTAILAYAGYPLAEIERILESKGELVPTDITEQLSEMKKKKRRINDLITSVFHYYGLNNGISQTITSVLSSAHDDSLMTISDLIRLIEDDIEAGTKYNVEPLIDKRAVTIQTVHKSKGLEYPVVLIVGLNDRSFPNGRQGSETLRFNDNTGVRSTYCYIGNDEHSMVVKSWKTAAVRAATPIDFSEERRLLFVAMTRAKQYICLTAYNPSKFFTYYSSYKEKHTDDENSKYIENITPEAYDPRAEASPAESSKPKIGDYQKKRMSVSVHDLMSTLDKPDSDGKKEGNGREHGDNVHKNAYLCLKNKKYDTELGEMKNVIKIIEDRRGAKLSGEIKFVLPIDDVSVKGTIDLLAEYDDRIEIHDYKSDLDEDFIEQYRLQLSVYYYAVASMGKKVECYIDFVALDKKEPVEPLPIEYIKERIDAYKESLKRPD